MQYSSSKKYVLENKFLRVSYYHIICFSLPDSWIAVDNASLLLPAATKLWPRLCFYTCVWFCLQGGALRTGPPRQGEPPRTRQTPPGPGRLLPPDQADTPPDQADTPLDQADPPGPGRHPLRREEHCSIRSMSGRYASFLVLNVFTQVSRTLKIEVIRNLIWSNLIWFV